MAPMTVSDEEEARHRRRLWMLGLGALAIVGAGAGVALWMSAPDGGQAGDPFPQPKVAMPRTPDTQNTELEKELSFSRLMEILGMESQKPAVAPFAKSFAKTFASYPELKRTYEDFKKKSDLGQKPTAKEFMASLRSQPAFGRMASDFGHSGGGSGAMMSFTHNPELRRFLADQDRLVRGGGGAADRDKKAVLAKGPLGSGKGADGASGTTGSALKGGSGAFNTADLAQLASAGPTVGAGGAAGTQGAGGGGAGPDAHDATKLDKDWKDEKNITLSDDVKKLNKLLQQYPCLASLGEAKLLRFINGADIDKLGLWGACFQLKWFSDCRATSCTPPVGEHPCWQACLDANGDNERTCIQKVRTQPGCSQADVPGDIWAANCVPKRNPTTGKCVSPTPPIAECGLGTCTDAPASSPEAAQPTAQDRADAAAKFSSDPNEQAMREMTCNCTGQAAVEYEAKMLAYQREQGTDFNDASKNGTGLHYDGAGDWALQTLRDSPDNLLWVKTNDQPLWERMKQAHPELRNR